MMMRSKSHAANIETTLVQPHHRAGYLPRKLSSSKHDPYVLGKPFIVRLIPTEKVENLGAGVVGATDMIQMTTKRFNNLFKCHR
ncbi:hypothetical protein BH23CHL2_BH23CHL2_09920 [soil metagenome]